MGFRVSIPWPLLSAQPSATSSLGGGSHSRRLALCCADRWLADLLAFGGMHCLTTRVQSSKRSEPTLRLGLSPSPEKLPVAPVLLGCTLLTLLIGWGDYLTGYDVSFAVFYALPVIGVVWFAGRKAGVLMAVIAVVIRFTADLQTGHQYSSNWVWIWNAFVALAYLCLIVIGFSAVRAQLNQTQTRVRQLESTLPVCTCCKRIEDHGGNWSTLETYVEEHFGSTPSRKLCPDCSRKFHAKTMGPGSGIR